MIKFLLCIVAASSLLISNSPAALAQDVKRGITKVKGDVYRFQNKFHFSLVVVTADGVVVVDPINNSAASWLKSNLNQITTSRLRI